MTDEEKKAFTERCDAIRYNKEEDRMHEEDQALFLAAAAELTRLWAVLAEKEAALCRARDYLTTIKSSVENIAGAFVGYVDVDAMINGLYENTPCPHEEAAKRLNSALEEA